MMGSRDDPATLGAGPTGPSGDAAPARRPSPLRPTRRMPLGKLVAVALVANLFLAAGGAAVLAPVETGRWALDTYDGLPPWLRTLFGDEGLETGGAEETVRGDVDRGPLGDWLEELYLAALEGDRAAQLAYPLELAVDVPLEGWTDATTAEVSFRTFDSGFRYRLVTSASDVAPDLTTTYDVETTEGSASLTLPEGVVYLHAQAADDQQVGPVSTAGPLRVDRTPPPAPRLDGGSAMTVSDYHYTLRWAAVADDAPIVAYRLETSRTGSAWDTVAVLAPDETTYTERNRPNGDYWYRVRAVNAAGLVSAPTDALRLTVDARANLQPPAPGDWHYGVQATYDSVIHLWDLSEPQRYLSLNDLSASADPPYGGLSAADFATYTDEGWGIELDHAGLCAEAAGALGGQCTWDAADGRYRIVGGEKNTLEIGIDLFAWLFDATDYDFDKFNDPTGGDFLKASETFERGGGICGDLTALYLTVMRMAGVPARPVHGYLVNNEDGIGGFHMWAEIYVGGDDPTGGGWLPVDVSGVSGEYDPSFLNIYFGLANPMYLQLGIQKDLGEPDLPRDDPRARWNVWANLQYTYYGKGGQPDITFDADATVAESEAVMGRLWFDEDTRERVFCEGSERCKGISMAHYFDGLRGRSVRSIDYGADLTWSDGSVEEITLRMKYPEDTASNQVAIYTPYLHDASCRSFVAETTTDTEGFMQWTIDGTKAPCSR